MGFRGKMAYAVDLIIVKYFPYSRFVADIGLNESIPLWIFLLNIRQVFRISGIGEFVKVDDTTRIIGFF
jgi:hypothetical protein